MWKNDLHIEGVLVYDYSHLLIDFSTPYMIDKSRKPKILLSDLCLLKQLRLTSPTDNRADNGAAQSTMLIMEINMLQKLNAVIVLPTKKQGA